ncbi:hypothetical protein DUNSADRAFT_2927 [Dunaliella salina]|uniref:Encoded protein n=1 Tax=Dunaliella salina TaxID=3046 RepID=A0ABQ7GUV4_DUNSA|nr:hypothetical protein DUNSADRAFT_2927 [Dunaliella salina]|eukprot:KAF5838391.1 hypothetical protein DUNSADRAFT_2927 [Dunaliella salina]
MQYLTNSTTPMHPTSRTSSRSKGKLPSWGAKEIRSSLMLPPAPMSTPDSSSTTSSASPAQYPRSDSPEVKTKV